MQVKLPFQRNSFCGLEFNWYIVDRDGCIAQVSTGFGPMPAALFDDEDAYNTVWDYFEQLPQICDARLSDAGVARVESSPGGDYSTCLKEARRGLYIYDETGYGPHYRLWAIPRTALTIDQLPEHVRDYLDAYRLPDLAFPELPDFNVELLFKCR